MTAFLLGLDPSFMLLTVAAGVFLDACAFQDAQHMPGWVQAGRMHVRLHKSCSVAPAAVVASPATSTLSAHPSLLLLQHWLSPSHELPPSNSDCT